MQGAEIPVSHHIYHTSIIVIVRVADLVVFKLSTLSKSVSYPSYVIQTVIEALLTTLINPERYGVISSQRTLRK
jgi:Ca2+/Na+ antiporter